MAVSAATDKPSTTNVSDNSQNDTVAESNDSTTTTDATSATEASDTGDADEYSSGPTEEEEQVNQALALIYADPDVRPADQRVEALTAESPLGAPAYGHHTTPDLLDQSPAEIRAELGQLEANGADSATIVYNAANPAHAQALNAATAAAADLGLELTIRVNHGNWTPTLPFDVGPNGPQYNAAEGEALKQNLVGALSGLSDAQKATITGIQLGNEPNLGGEWGRSGTLDPYRTGQAVGEMFQHIGPDIAAALGPGGWQKLVTPPPASNPELSGYEAQRAYYEGMLDATDGRIFEYAGQAGIHAYMNPGMLGGDLPHRVRQPGFDPATVRDELGAVTSSVALADALLARGGPVPRLNVTELGLPGGDPAWLEAYDRTAGALWRREMGGDRDFTNVSVWGTYPGYNTADAQAGGDLWRGSIGGLGPTIEAANQWSDANFSTTVPAYAPEAVAPVPVSGLTPAVGPAAYTDREHGGRTYGVPTVAGASVDINESGNQSIFLSVTRNGQPVDGVEYAFTPPSDLTEVASDEELAAQVGWFEVGGRGVTGQEKGPGKAEYLIGGRDVDVWLKDQDGGWVKVAADMNSHIFTDTTSYGHTSYDVDVELGDVQGRPPGNAGRWQAQGGYSGPPAAGSRGSSGPSGGGRPAAPSLPRGLEGLAGLLSGLDGAQAWQLIRLFGLLMYLGIDPLVWLQSLMNGGQTTAGALLRARTKGRILPN